MLHLLIHWLKYAPKAIICRGFKFITLRIVILNSCLDHCNSMGYFFMINIKASKVCFMDKYKINPSMLT